jgi:hypothetical protein
MFKLLVCRGSNCSTAPTVPPVTLCHSIGDPCLPAAVGGAFPAPRPPSSLLSQASSNAHYLVIYSSFPLSFLLKVLARLHCLRPVKKQVAPPNSILLHHASQTPRSHHRCRVCLYFCRSGRGVQQALQRHLGASERELAGGVLCAHAVLAQSRPF